MDLPTDQTNLGSGPVPIESRQQRLFSSASPRFRRHLDLPHPHNINSRPRATTCATTPSRFHDITNLDDRPRYCSHEHQRPKGRSSLNPSLPLHPIHPCLPVAGKHSGLPRTLHTHCVVWFGIRLLEEHTWIFTAFAFSRIIPYFSCTRWNAFWETTMRMEEYGSTALLFLFFPRASLAAKVTLV